MGKAIYTIPNETDLHINWLSYDKEREYLLIHDSVNHFVEWITLEGEQMGRFDYKEILSLTDVNKAIDRHPVMPWIAMAGKNKWVVYNYELHDTVFVKEEIAEEITGISFNPWGTEIWVNTPSEKKVAVYDTTDFELKNYVAVHGDLSLPVRWHPSKEWFSLLEIKPGGYKAMFGKAREYALVNNMELNVATDFPHKADITFSPDGNYLFLSDVAVHVNKFPSMEKKYSITSEVAKEWNAPTPPVIVTDDKKYYLAFMKLGFFSLYDLDTGEEFVRRHHFGDNTALLKISDNLLVTIDNFGGEVYVIDPVHWLEQEKKIVSKVNAVAASSEESRRYLELDRLLYKYEANPEDPIPTERDLVEEILRSRSLNLKNATLESVPSLVYELENLEELDLYGNSLKEISPAIRNLKNLKSLRLSNNQLTSLPVEIAELEKLEELYLVNNPIKKLVPLFFHNARGLKNLYMHNLDIKRVPHAIYELSSLECLSISSCHVQDLDFRRFDSLRYVSIYGEEMDIEELEKEYSDCWIDFSYHGGGSEW